MLVVTLHAAEAAVASFPIAAIEGSISRKRRSPEADEEDTVAPEATKKARRVVPAPQEVDTPAASISPLAPAPPEGDALMAELLALRAEVEALRVEHAQKAQAKEEEAPCLVSPEPLAEAPQRKRRAAAADSAADEEETRVAALERALGEAKAARVFAALCAAAATTDAEVRAEHAEAAARASNTRLERSERQRAALEARLEAVATAGQAADEECDALERAAEHLCRQRDDALAEAEAQEEARAAAEAKAALFKRLALPKVRGLNAAHAQLAGQAAELVSEKAQREQLVANATQLGEQNELLNANVGAANEQLGAAYAELDAAAAEQQALRAQLANGRKEVVAAGYAAELHAVKEMLAVATACGFHDPDARYPAVCDWGTEEADVDSAEGAGDAGEPAAIADCVEADAERAAALPEQRDALLAALQRQVGAERACLAVDYQEALGSLAEQVALLKKELVEARA
jgi:hypothetical protein